MPKSLFYSLLSILFLLILSACSPNDLPGVVTITAPLPSPGAATSTPFVVEPSLPSLTPAVTATPDLATTTMQADAAVATIDPSAPTPTALPTDMASLRPLYAIEMMMDYDAKSIDVTQEITYLNQTGQPLDQVILAVQPNLIANVFNLASVAVDGQKVETFTLEGQKLEVLLPVSLAAGATLKLGLAYTLTLPLIEQGDPNIVRPRIFGVAERQVNLVDWYPFIVPYLPGQGWVLHDPWYYGEHLVYDKADFDISLRFTNTKDLPVIAASAPAEALSDGTHYRLENARNFVFSMGRQFKVVSEQIDSGVTVYSYYLGDWNKPAAEAVLAETVKAVKTYTELFGPYPHKTLSAIEGDFADGMEFDGLYFLTAYNLYDNTEKNLMVTIAVHETAHQWWFGRVANDQAEEPWLDEALATYSERLFYEKNYPNDVNWWWDFRINQYEPVGSADTRLYNGGGFRPYTNAVYFMGANFLEDLRQQIGDETFFAFLKAYSTLMNDKISTADDFFRILRMHINEDISPLLTKYFLNQH